MSKGERYDGDTPPLADTIKAIAENVNRSRYTFLPCQVVLYDPVRQCADVTPVVQTEDVNGVPVIFPVLTCCPVLWPSGGGYSFVFPLIPGDICMVGFTTIAMAQWWSTGSPAALPESSRRGSLSDGFVMPGLRPQTLPLVAPALGALAIGKDDGTANVVIDLAGTVTVNSPIAQQVNAPLHQVGLGAFSVAQAEAILAELQAIAFSLTTIPPTGGPPATPYIAPTTPAAIATLASRSD